MTSLDAAARRGLALRWRIVLVLLGELGVAAEIAVGTRPSPPVSVWLFGLTPLMFVLGLLVTVQGHHRLPVAWHVVVTLGWTAALMIAPWASTWTDTRSAGGFDGAYVTVLAVYALVAVEVSCALALLRPAGSSWITHRTVEQARG